LNRDELLNEMLQQGFRITEQRKALVEIILNYNRPFTAIELYQAMAKRFRGVSFGTIYKNLKIFGAMRILETFAMANEIRYRVLDREQPRLHKHVAERFHKETTR